MGAFIDTDFAQALGARPERLVPFRHGDALPCAERLNRANSRGGVLYDEPRGIKFRIGSTRSAGVV
jgi:hypothetical protein